MEEWKTIEEYPNYSVSNYGNVRNDKFGWMLTPRFDRKGYYNVNLHKNGKAKNKYIHQLVATYFCENTNGYVIVDHIDRVVTNNNHTNLRWVTQSQNMRNVTKRNGTSSKYPGVSYHKCCGKWRAYLRMNKQIYLGLYETEEDVFEAFKQEVISRSLQEFYPTIFNLTL